MGRIEDGRVEMGAAALIDRARYPIDRLEDAAGRRLIAGAQTQLRENGVCILPGFIRPEAQRAMAAEANGVAPAGRGVLLQQPSRRHQQRCRAQAVLGTHSLRIKP